MAVHVFEAAQVDAARAFWTAPENAQKAMILRRDNTDYIIFESPNDAFGHPTGYVIDKGTVGTQYG